MRERWTSVAIALLAATSGACVGPRAPSAAAPYSVRLVGAADGALRGASRGGLRVFAGSSGRDYAIEVTNDTPSAVGISIVIDGLDAKTGEPVRSCEGIGGWTVDAEARAIVRGFSVSETRIATYRFAPRSRSLAAITKGARREASGTIEVCFFSLRRRSAPVTDRPTTFGGVVEREPSPLDKPIVGELRDDSPLRETEREQDSLVTRVLVTYEDEDGAPLGTAPPPAGVARIDRDVEGEPIAPSTAPAGEEPRETKPTRPTKQTKQTKATTKATTPPSVGKPAKPEKPEK